MKTTWNIIKKETRKVNSLKVFPSLLVNDGTLKDPKGGENAFNNFVYNSY
jgi:hypothetical protein